MENDSITPFLKGVSMEANKPPGPATGYLTQCPGSYK